MIERCFFLLLIVEKSLAGGMNTNLPDFPSIAFQSSLSTQAILFGVFGFLYSVFGMYSSLASPTNPQRAPIVSRLKKVCSFLVLLISLNATLTIGSLILMYLSGTIASLGSILLAFGFLVTIVAIVIISARVLRYME